MLVTILLTLIFLRASESLQGDKGQVSDWSPFVLLFIVAVFVVPMVLRLIRDFLIFCFRQRYI